MAWACWALNLTIVTVYATLGPEGASYGIKQTHAPVVVCDAKLSKNMTKVGISYHVTERRHMIIAFVTLSCG